MELDYDLFLEKLMDLPCVLDVNVAREEKEEKPLLYDFWKWISVRLLCLRLEISS